MVLQDDDIARFQELYKSNFGTEISREDAYEQGIKLMRLMSLVYQPMTQEQHNNIQKHREETLPLLVDRITNYESQ
ncbi:MAG: hypothetical protein WCJ29_02085 [bacterium]